MVSIKHSKINPMTKLSIIILSFNTKAYTEKCIRSVVRHYDTQLKSGEFELILVDNASKDKTLEAITKIDPRVKIIRNRENVGFAEGNNRGVRHAKGEYVLFLNSDTEVLDTGFTEIVEFLEKNKKAEAVGGKIYNSDGSPQPSVGKFYTLFNLFIMLLGAEKVGLLRQSPSIIKTVDWVSGAFLMVRRLLFEKMEGFDSNLFMYMEDMEFCFRMKKAGYDVYFYPYASIVHQEQGSSNRSFAIVSIYKGLLYFYEKHGNFLSVLLVKTLLLLKAYAAISIGIVIRNNYLTNTYRKAIQF